MTKSRTERELHLSHSQITEFSRCPRKYHLHRRLGLPAEFCPSGLLFGSAVHEALATYHQMRLEGREAPSEQLWQAFRKRWGAEEGPVRFKRGESARSLQAKARKLLEFYAAHPGCSGKVMAVEEPFRLQLSEALPPVWGIIDLVEMGPEGRLVLTDFKTAASRTEPDPDQLILYRQALKALEYPGNGEVSARYVVLLKTREPDMVVFEPEIGPADSQRLRKLYSVVWQDIGRGCSFPRLGWWCRDCQWRGHCDQA